MFKSILVATVLIATTASSAFASDRASWSEIRDGFRSYGFEKPVAAAKSVQLFEFVKSTAPRTDERMGAWMTVLHALQLDAEAAEAEAQALVDTAVEAGLAIGAQGVHLDMMFIDMAIEGFTSAQVATALETANDNLSTTAVRSTRSDVIGLISVGPAGPTFGSIIGN